MTFLGQGRRRNLRNIVLVDTLPAEQVEVVYQAKQDLLTGAASLRSRFASGLSLFETGRAAALQVDKERKALVEDQGILIDLDELAKRTRAWGEVKAPASFCFEKKLSEDFSACWAKWCSIIKRRSLRLSREKAALFEEIGNLVSQPFKVVVDGVRANVEKHVLKMFKDVLRSSILPNTRPARCSLRPTFTWTPSEWPYAASLACHVRVLLGLCEGYRRRSRLLTV